MEVSFQELAEMLISLRNLGGSGEVDLSYTELVADFYGDIIMHVEADTKSESLKVIIFGDHIESRFRKIPHEGTGCRITLNKEVAYLFICNLYTTACTL